MVRALGFDLIVARDAAHALEILEQQRVDLLLSDVIMPDMHGPEIYRMALVNNPQVLALFVSGYTEDMLDEVPLGNRGVAYLSKPFTLQDLRSALSELSLAA